LANAYASSVWNDRKGSDCWIPYWRSWEGMSPPAKVTCSASGSNPGTYLDHVSQTEWCKSSPTYMGGEYDWMRTWNKVLFHPTAPFDMAKINGFIQTGSGWNCGSAYDTVLTPLTPCHVYGGQGFWARLLTGTTANGVKARLTAADAGPRYGVDH
jgi:hypothetical protein